eukprot:5221193-Pleurochrysis_carterae.AAC.2
MFCWDGACAWSYVCALQLPCTAWDTGGSSSNACAWGTMLATSPSRFSLKNAITGALEHERGCFDASHRSLGKLEFNRQEDGACRSLIDSYDRPLCINDATLTLFQTPQQAKPLRAWTVNYDSTASGFSAICLERPSGAGGKVTITVLVLILTITGRGAGAGAGAGRTYGAAQERGRSAGCGGHREQGDPESLGSGAQALNSQNFRRHSASV